MIKAEVNKFMTVTKTTLKYIFCQFAWITLHTLI